MKQKIFIFLLVLMSFLSSAHAASEKIAQIRISGLSRIGEDTVRHVLPFQEGDPFRVQKVDEAITALRRWGAFDAIQVDIDSTPEGKLLHFRLDEATVILLIEIQGNYPFVENRIRKYFTLKAGDIYTPQSVKAQVDRIKTFYEQQGYINTEVEILETAEPTENGVTITFAIHRGEQLRYRNIIVNGNKAYPLGRFVSALNPWKSYSEKRLKASLRKLTDFYHEHGYPRARIEVREKEIDYHLSRVDLQLEVYEGPHVKVEFQGNRHASDRTLKKTMTISREGSFDQYEIDASIAALKKLFAERGYPDAHIEAQRVDLSEEKKIISFVMEEGEPQFIKQIRFPGRKKVAQRKLKKVMANQERSLHTRGPYKPHLQTRDSAALKKVLESEGFLDGAVEAWKVKKGEDLGSLTVQIPLSEGEQTIVEEVLFQGNHAASTKDLLDVLKVIPGKTFDPHFIEEERKQLLVFYSDHGYPYAQAKASIASGNVPYTTIISYEIEEGPEVRIGEVLIVGDVLTSQKAIKKAMGIGHGDLFSTQKIVEAQLNIRRLGPFSSVSVETIGIQEKEEKIHLLVKVEEQRPFLVDIEFGYSTDKQYVGNLKFTNLNAFGWAKRNTLKLIGGREISGVELGWVDPRLFGSQVEMTMNTSMFYEEEPAFRSLKLGGGVGWFRRFDDVGLLFRFDLNRKYLLEGNVDAADAQSIRNSTILETSASTSYDSRDSFADPRKGLFALAAVTLLNEIKGKESNFMKLSLSTEYDFSPFRSITLSSAARLNRIERFGTNVSIPLDQRFFLGGDDTLRGFSEDSLGPQDLGKITGGRLRWILNEELRFRLFARFNFAFFYDMGQLTDDASELSIGGARQSAGFGFRYVTPVGPIRADYGFKLDRRTGEDVSRFHLTFGYVF